MWAAFVVAQRRFDDFEYLARRLGADAFAPIAAMAKAAWSSGRTDVAWAVFSASNRAGPERDRLREACVRLTGHDPPPYRPAPRLP
jgi:hypothetical protein